jgi:hypothetical protein
MDLGRITVSTSWILAEWIKAEWIESESLFAPVMVSKFILPEYSCSKK